MGTQPDQNFLTPTEAASRAMVTTRCVTYWCDRAPALAVRVMGRRWRVDPAALDRLLRGQKPPVGGDHAKAA